MKLDAPVPLAASQTDRAAEALTSALLDDPLFSRVFPDAAERRRSMRRFFGGIIAYCLACGEVYATPSVSGVACWLPPGRTENSLRCHLRTRFALPRAVLSFGIHNLRQGSAAARCTEELRRRAVGRRPHWYLMLLGVDPAFQGQGIGSSLIRPVLARADAAGASCYLETQTERNVAFYRKHGFEVAGEKEVPGLAVRIWGMVRAPGGTVRFPCSGERVEGSQQT